MAELYSFKYDGVYYNYSPTIFSKTFAGFTFLPMRITRSSIHLTDNLGKSPVTFTFDRTNEFARMLLAYLPETPIEVTVYKDEETYWFGQVKNIVANPQTIELSCDSIYTGLQKNGLPQLFMVNCRHTLYSEDCGVPESNYTQNYPVTDVVSASLSIPGLTGIYHIMTGGIAKLNGQTRHVVYQYSSDVILNYPFNGTQNGTLFLSPGCNLTKERCGDFGNTVNFGGYPYIPKVNPFSSTGAL